MITIMVMGVVNKPSAAYLNWWAELPTIEVQSDGTMLLTWNMSDKLLSTVLVGAVGYNSSDSIYLHGDPNDGMNCSGNSTILWWGLQATPATVPEVGNFTIGSNDTFLTGGTSDTLCTEELNVSTGLAFVIFVEWSTNESSSLKDIFYIVNETSEESPSTLVRDYYMTAGLVAAAVLITVVLCVLYVQTVNPRPQPAIEGCPIEIREAFEQLKREGYLK
jgi:hypothetical protein